MTRGSNATGGCDACSFTDSATTVTTTSPTITTTTLADCQVPLSAQASACSNIVGDDLVIKDCDDSKAAGMAGNSVRKREDSGQGVGVWVLMAGTCIRESHGTDSLARKDTHWQEEANRFSTCEKGEKTGAAKHDCLVIDHLLSPATEIASKAVNTSKVARESVSKTARESVSKTARESVSKTARESTSQVVWDSASKTARERASKVVRDSTSKTARESAPDISRESAPHSASDELATAHQRVRARGGTPTPHGISRTASGWLAAFALMAAVALTEAQASAADLLQLSCSNVCSHGTCLYPVSTGSKAILTCRCHEGWGGEHCSIPCTKSCGHGQCVFVGDRQACLCHLGYVGADCSQPGYDVATLLNLARLIDTGSPIYTPPSPSSSSSSSSPAPLREQQQQQQQQEPQPQQQQQPGPSTTASPQPSSKLKTGRGDLLQALRDAGDEVLVRLVSNPREHVQRNVKQGSSQCMPNFVCRNGGRCVAGSYGGFRCQCKAPYFGTFCQSVCPKACFNGGRCVKLRQRMPEQDVTLSAVTLSVPRAYVYRCVCPVQFSGEHCEKKVAT